MDRSGEPPETEAPEYETPEYETYAAGPAESYETAEAPSGTETKVRERTTTFAPGQLVSLAAGVFFVVLGLIAVLRADIDGSLSRPVVEVFGWSHTAWLGVVELAVGVVLVLAGITALGRIPSVFLGLLMLIAGIIVLAQVDSVPDQLGVERSYGWPVAVIGGLAAVAALVVPVWRTHTRRETFDVR